MHLFDGNAEVGLAQMVDDLLDGKSLLGHLVTPFFQGPRRPDSLTKHLDPVKGGRPMANNLLLSKRLFSQADVHHETDKEIGT